MEHAPEDSEIEVGFTGLLGNVKLNISAPGEAFDIAESSNVVSGLELDGFDSDAENAIRNLILRARSDTFRYKNKNHRSTIQITVNQSNRKQLYLTLGALVLSVLLGLLFKLILPESVQSGLNVYLLTPIKTMFLNALKMVTDPVVLFSIISCLAQFENLHDLGKIGAKVMGMYIFTTLLAIMTGIGIFLLIRPGNASLAAMVTDAAVETSGTAEISILETIVNIIPADVVSPFLKADMLQILFMAILIGIAWVHQMHQCR
ncbi:MAG: cation:dicarboxylase symporter family transporter [Lachnospiraceae bacterium]|nr:cation:dicarboxylase symporter family transporter [Lachnospiraceae bacterium]